MIKIHKISCDTNYCSCPDMNRTSIAKYLGIYIDCNFKWSHQIQQIVKKVRYLIYIFYKLRSILNTKQLMSIYYALFWSIATYGIVAWGGAYDNNMKALIDIQKRIIKIIYNKSKLFSSEIIFRENKIISVKKFYIEKALLTNFESMYNDYKTISATKRNTDIIPKKFIKKLVDVGIIIFVTKYSTR